MKPTHFNLIEILAQTDESKNDNNAKTLYDLKRILHRIINEALTNRQREILILYFFEQMNQKQIAEKLGVDCSTVSRTKARALKRIKDIVKYCKLR